MKPKLNPSMSAGAALLMTRGLAVTLPASASESANAGATAMDGRALQRNFSVGYRVARELEP